MDTEQTENLMDPGDADSEERKLERLEDTLWVIRAQTGDVEAVTNLIHRYEKRLLYYLRRLVLQDDDALDLYQEVWVAALDGLPTLQFPEAFRVWIYRIAHHKAARFVRNEIRHREMKSSLENAEPTESNPDLDRELNAESVHRALDRLPPDHRDLLTLYYLRDLSIQELAVVLDCPLGTIKSRLHHARTALRQLIERHQL